MATFEFKTVLDAEHYFQGLARQELDFHQALGELLDNSLSARQKSPYGEGLEPMTIEVTIEERDDGSYLVQVADHGVGMSFEDITSRIFNPGGQGSQPGNLNEHGFGLKNALALLTGGNSTNFTLLTRTQDADLDPDRFYSVSGPLSTDMVVRDDATREDWSDGLHHLGPAPTGTKISVIVQSRYFKSVFRRGNPGFDKLVERLGEHIGVMHRYFLTAGNQVRVAYRRSGQEWTHHSVRSILVPIEGEAKTKTKTIQFGGVPQEFIYTRGVLDYNVKDPEAEQERGWPYPLRIYYQGSNARCGVDIVVRDRVIKSGVFEEIWPEIGKTVDFNKFVGEVKVGESFRTTNNKTGLDPHGENWEQLLKELGEEEFRPEKTTRSQSEESLRDSLVTILEGTFTGKSCIKNRSVWAGGCQIDIFIEAAADNIRIYELKVTEGRVLYLYQLLMGWDGLVKENVNPTTGILVCSAFSAILSEAVAAANLRVDAAGNHYNIELKTISELLPAV